MPIEPAQEKHGMAAAVESTAAKFAARFVWPALVSVVGFFVVTMLGDMRTAQKELAASAKELSNNQYDLARKVEVLSTRLDAQVIRQVESNTKRLDDHDQRMRLIERSVKTP